MSRLSMAVVLPCLIHFILMPSPCSSSSLHHMALVQQRAHVVRKTESALTGLRCHDSFDWIDTLGNQCADYETNESLDCRTAHDNWGNNASALHACCKCGGGCLDHPWVDSAGYSCSHYASMKWCTRDGGYGEGWNSSMGVFEDWALMSPATTGCCQCGGGDLRVPAAPSLTTSAGRVQAQTGSSADARCYNYRGWEDRRGNKCHQYEKRDQLTCRTPTHYMVNDTSALNACCKCGGGCRDFPDWTDYLGNTCWDYFSENFCSSDGGYGSAWDTDLWGSFDLYADISPSTACCRCGGGILRHTTSTTTLGAAGIQAMIDVAKQDTAHYFIDDLYGVEFSGLGNHIKIQTLGLRVTMLFLGRPSWVKPYRCNGEFCEECSGVVSCIGVDATDGLMKVHYSALHGTWTRFGLRVHANCPVKQLKLEAQLEKIRGGEVRFYWNGIEVNRGNAGIDKGKKIPALAWDTPLRRKEDIFYAHVITVPHDGNEWVMEFVPFATTASGALAWFTTVNLKAAPQFAMCEDTKTCVSTFADFGFAGAQLRNNNHLKLRCLQGLSIPSTYDNVCREWLACIGRSSSNTSVADGLRQFLQAAGIEEEEEEEEERSRSQVSLSRRAKTSANSEVCVDPLTEDIESWDCSCAETAEQRCASIEGDMQDYSKDVCLRALMCNHHNICEDWYSDFCLSAEVNATMEALQRRMPPLLSANRSEPAARSAPPRRQSASAAETDDVEDPLQVLRRRASAAEFESGEDVGSELLEDSLKSKSCQ